MKISHSGINLYSTCPRAYKYRYKENIHSRYKGSALYFGSAMDNALNHLLEGLAAHEVAVRQDSRKKDNLLNETIEVFHKYWEQQEDKNFGLIELPKYPFIKYSKYDFDYELLDKSDWKELFSMTKNPMDKKSEIQSKLENMDFEDLDEDDRMFYNYCNWLSLRKKGEFFIKAYYKQLVPRIVEVIEVQKAVEIKDGEENILSGYIDFIAKVKDDNGKTVLVVADNKTSSLEYSEDSVETSSQLAKYRFILNNNYGYNIEKAAYFVINKKLNKEKVCKKCGHLGSGNAKTCNAEVDGVRCHGEWEKNYKVDTQLIIQDIPEYFENLVMENTDEVIQCIKAEVFPRNLTACEGKFGRCEYYAKCYGKDQKDNLVKFEKEEKK